MNIVITGASRGIGYALTKRFAKKTNSNIIAISRNEKALESLQNECQSLNPASLIFPFVLDISDTENLHENLNNYLVENKINSIDILVNNAGLLINKAFEKFPASEILDIFNVNIVGAAVVAQTLLPYLRKGTNPHIVNITSMGGVQGSVKFPGLSVYSAAKGALSILTECLAEELKEEKISVNALALGAVQTEMLSEAFPEYKAPISPEEMASYIADFAMKAQKVMNGKILPVSLSTP